MNQFHKDILKNQKILYSYALSLTKNEDDAKDLVQDTLLKAIRKENLYSEGTNLKAWLCTIMKNIFLDSFKHKNVKIRSYSEDIKKANNHKAENKVFENLSIELIQSEISKLDSNKQEIINLFTEGYNGYEIENKVNTNYTNSSTMRGIIFRIKNKLKQKLIELGY